MADLFDIAVAKKLAGGSGGGGGSSDFSTAEVTVTNNGNNLIYFAFPSIMHDAFDEWVDPGPQVSPNTSITCQPILYKGAAFGLLRDAFESMLFDGITVTGDITCDSGDIAITGDGTITYTPS